MKKFLVVFITLALVFSLVSCTNGEANQEKNVSVDDISSTLISNLEFGEELELTDDDITIGKYGIDASYVSDVSRYAGSGATADEVAVFLASSEENVETVKNAISSRIEYLRDGYSSYGPQEVPKINDCALITEGLYIIFVISNDSSNTSNLVSQLFN